jgi:uncharacterized protein YyaL (SSP411 family)
MNRLGSESSLYLRQHAGNPVDWYPWGEAAFAAAKSQNKPIFLSVGYSACHWCHVMEHESFEDEATAKVLNDHFVSVKVDREERPDVDQIYMTAHGVLTRGEGGGWPLSVFLTPAGTPFYAGTYFPPDDRYGRPSFRRVLLAVHDAWTTSRPDLEKLGAGVADYLKSAAAERSDGALSPELLTAAGRLLQRIHDPVHGGFGGAPKFPHAIDLRVLFRLARRTGDGFLADLACFTLKKMAHGGIYDQVGGGFHRYSVDEKWLVPHFEKMLYDNALLPVAYVEAFQITGDPEFKRIACETLDYVLKEMTSPPGGFYATQDADSEGEEGKFYVWSEPEIDAVLGPLAAVAKRVFGTSSNGNFEGHNILTRASSDVSASHLAETKARLYAARSTRIWPGRDEKIVTGWNGLMISAFATAGAAFGEPRYVEAAVKAADYVLTHLRGPQGKLFRTAGVGQPPKIAGYLEDSAFMIAALIDLYEATFDPKWVRIAVELADDLIARYADPAGGFFATATDHESLIARPKDAHDGSVPAGNGVAAEALLRMSRLVNGVDDSGYRGVAEKTLTAYRGLMAESPAAAGQFLLALDTYFGPDREVVVVGPKDNPETVDVLSTLRSKYDPHRLIAFHDPADGPTDLPLFRDRPAVGGRVTTYECTAGVCATPVVGGPPRG